MRVCVRACVRARVCVRTCVFFIAHLRSCCERDMVTIVYYYTNYYLSDFDFRIMK